MTATINACEKFTQEKSHLIVILFIIIMTIIIISVLILNEGDVSVKWIILDQLNFFFTLFTVLFFHFIYFSLTFL